MTLATALVAGNDPLPALAEEAVRCAMGKASLARPNGVLLFLTPEFARQAAAAVMAVARVAQCTQIAGGVASGVFTEDGSVLDRPAVAVMVFGDPLRLDSGDGSCAQNAPLLCYTSSLTPSEWLPSDGAGRFGGGFSLNNPLSENLVWQQSRLSNQHRCCLQISGATLRITTSCGLQRLGSRHRVDRHAGFDLLQLAGEAAALSLRRALPDDLRDRPDTLHHLAAVRFPHDDPDERFGTPVSIVAVNRDNSLTLSEPLADGDSIAWALRSPDAAVAEMEAAVAQAHSGKQAPLGALMFSCIGRGPYFYGGEDRDLDTVRRHRPGMPILGVYGTMQLAPDDGRRPASNRSLQNSVVTAFVYSR